jgi:hypothetical protein
MFKTETEKSLTWGHFEKGPSISEVQKNIFPTPAIQEWQFANNALIIYLSTFVYHKLRPHNNAEATEVCLFYTRILASS